MKHRIPGTGSHERRNVGQQIACADAHTFIVQQRGILWRDQIGQHDTLNVPPRELAALQQSRGETASEKAGTTGDEDVHAWPFAREAW